MSGSEPVGGGLDGRLVGSHAVALKVVAEERINLALQQNRHPVVSEVVLRNRSGRVLRGLAVTARLEPALAPAVEARVDALEVGGEQVVRLPRFELAATALAELNERMRARLVVEVRDSAGAPLGEWAQDIDVLAHNEWQGGGSSPPELLAAFCMPNDPAVAAWMREAAELLHTWTGSAALDGYQSKDPERVRRIAAAIFGAFQRTDVVYTNPPAGFEATGQKIRTPAAIRESRLGTCLDLALLAAACLEQSGLHPLVVLIEGHAFTGVWLGDERFPDPVQADPTGIQKRVKLGAMTVFDPTLATHKANDSFEYAERIGLGHLDDPNAFVVAVDIAAARRAQVRPLPSPGAALDLAIPDRGAVTGAPAPAAAVSLAKRAQAGAAPVYADDATAARLAGWRSKLLDLTLRNRLLNNRHGKRLIRLADGISPAEVEDGLASGRSFDIHGPLQVSRVGPAPDDMETQRVLLGDEVAEGRLRTGLSPAELDATLVHLYRQAHLAREESGSNTLFMTLGTLEWYDLKARPASDGTLPPPRRAPLLLVPLEMTRTRAGGAIRVRQSDEDPVVNVTLLELLRQDFGIVFEGLEPLPQDEAGIDVPLIFRVIREAIVDQTAWRVVEDAAIGLFTFSKFLMWRDLTDRFEELRKNPVVRHIVERVPLPEWAREEPPQAEAINELLDRGALVCPKDADPSQLRAIAAAGGRTTFVLKGPPGTGKSQTITNLVAHCVWLGKRVLFVSEKMAALEVVQRRLQEVGLGPFCLELHSNKTNKRALLEQLKLSLAARGAPDTDAWEAHAQRLGDRRKALERYIQVLRAPHDIGVTTYDITAGLIGLRDAPEVSLAIPTTGFDHRALETARELVDRLQHTARALRSAPAAHPLRALRGVRWTPGMEATIEARLDALVRASEAARSARSALISRLRLSGELRGAADHEALTATCRYLSQEAQPTRALVEISPWAPARARVEATVESGKAGIQAWAPLDKRWQRSLMSAPLEALSARFERWGSAFFLLAWVMLFAARRSLKAYAKGPLPRLRDTSRALEAARLARDAFQAVDESASTVGPWLGGWWDGRRSDWGRLERVTQDVERLRQLCARLRESGHEELADASLRLCCDAPETLAPGMATRVDVDGWLNTIGALEEKASQVSAELSLRPRAPWEASDALDDVLGAIERASARWRAHLAELRDWSSFVAAGEAVRKLGFGALVDAILGGAIAAEAIAPAFERGWRQAFVNELTRHEPALRDFRGPERERRMERFAELDRSGFELASDEIRGRAGASVPPPGPASGRDSEMAILVREMIKKRRHMPIRKLFRAIPTVLGRLKPCLLMSPLSVAQYLDPALPDFDLVVFDEASQIPVWDAIGAIGRAKQLIVVGDPKQLPPTNFFQRMESDDLIDENDFDEMESILDECIASQMPQLSLDWHYRSLHESLITFSNQRYYDGRLLTFPAAAHDVPGMGVELRPVPDGFYDRGRSRTNRGEADAILAELQTRLLERGARDTIGIVTFNSAQQALLSDLLDAARSQDPALERAIMALREPLFVKNLENVQGDERDIMMFSIAYGPDRSGKPPAMHFGPLNRIGGERRLNVAITRARKQLLVFATLTADQIDLRRTRALGVRHLKEYLRYAEHGRVASPATEPTVPAEAGSPFEDAVARELATRGFRVVRNVGQSGYRIDIAVVDPEAPGRFVIGIECDGATYHGTVSARERERLRRQVLTSQGWRLHRVWSTDWWHDRASALARLLEAVEGAIKDARAARAADAQGAGRAERPPQRDGAERDGPEPDAQGVGAPAPDGHRPDPPAPAPADLDAVVAQYQAGSRRTTDVGGLKGAEPFRAAVIAPVHRALQAFHAHQAHRLIAEQVCELMAQEAPVARARVERAIAVCWGTTATRRFRERLGRVLSTLARQKQLVVRGPFLWRFDQDPAGWSAFRIPLDPSEERREPSELPPEEVANAAARLLALAGSHSVDGLCTELARVFGFSRMGTRVQEAMEAGILHLIAIDGARREGDRVHLSRARAGHATAGV